MQRSHEWYMCRGRVVSRSILVLAFGAGVSSSAIAQTVVQPSVSSNANGSLPLAPLAPFADPDSTGNTAAFTALSHETPGECLAAMQVAWTETNHAANMVESDTTPTWEHLDTLPTSVYHAAAACAAPFTVATVPTSQLFNLFQLAVVLGDTTTATAARERWLAMPSTLRDRNETPVEMHANRLLDVLDGNWRSGLSMQLLPATAEAAADTTAHHMLQRLDALGPAAQGQQLEGWLSYTDRQLRIMEITGRWDPALIIASVDAMLARFDATPVAHWPFPPNASFNPMTTELLQLVWARGYVDPHGVSAFYDSLVAASHTAASSTRPFIAQIVQTLSQAGSPVAPLAGTYWFNTHGTAVWPQPGHVSLLAVVQNLAYYRSDLWKFRRLLAKYGTQGLTVTIVVKTQGYWLKDGVQTGPIPPSEEAADDSAYFLNYLKLPFTVVVVQTPFTQMPDGRVAQSAPVQFETAYGKRDVLVLSDRTGRLVLKDQTYASEGRLDAYIARALGISKQSQ